MADGRFRQFLRGLLAALLVVVLILIAAVVVLRLTNPRPKAQIGWFRLGTMRHARGELAGATVGDKLVVAGGLYGLGRTSRDVDVFNITERQWVIGTPLPAPRHHAAAAGLDGWVYVSGGASSVVKWEPRREVWRSRPGGAWEAVAPMPEGRVGHAMVAWSGRLYVIGGVGRTNSTLAYNPAHGWSKAAPLPAGRDHLRAVVWGDEIWVIGGRRSHLSKRVDIYTPRDDRWHSGPDLPKPMSAMAVGVLGGDLHVIGGENPSLIGGGVLTDHFVLRIDEHRWNPRPRGMLPVHGAGFGTYQEGLYIAGGATRAGALSVLSWTGVTQLYSNLPQQQI
jgi:hypothetical protein